MTGSAHARASSFALGLVLSISILATSLTSSMALAQDDFPKGPDAQMTPGDLCTKPTERRYPERIAYCARDVASDLKKQIFTDYDVKLGYNTTKMDRQQFKIDHFIPLCMGGSNEKSNLWPQHVSVYTVTDPIEPLACEKMAEGRLSQADAIVLVKRAKNDLSQVPAVLAELNAK